MASFNLVNEPWISCRMLLDGAPQEFSLKDTLCRAHEIKEVSDPSPLVTVCLHRLLLAVLHRIFGPPNLAEWQGLWAKGAWDANAVVAYLDQWADRFDLFHPERPFYQNIQLPNEFAKPKRPPKDSRDDNEHESGRIVFSKLVRERAATRNTTLFDHNFDASPRAFSCAESARYLIAEQLYALPDGSGYKTAPLTYGVATLLSGDSLFQTLLFNLLPYNEERPIYSDLEKDKPWWEYDSEEFPHDIPHGYLSYLTWPYRRVFISSPRQNSSATITHVFRKAGLGLDKEWTERLCDPMVSYSRSKAAGFQPVQLLSLEQIYKLRLESVP
jgi:CRISPR system Cascade subunit CasA